MTFVGADTSQLRELAGALRTMGHSVHQLISTLHTSAGELRWVGPDADQFRTEQCRAITAHGDMVVRSLESLSDVLSANAGAQDGVSASLSPSGSSGTTSLRDLMRMNWADGDRRWQSLTPEQQKAILAGKTSDVGELALVPPAARYAANRSLVEAEIARLEHQGGLTPADRARLQLYKTVVADGQQVLFFDPSGDGRIAVVQGDLSTAQHIAVSVPGVDTRMDSFGRMLDEGTTLARATDAHTAVVSWLGYDTPQGGSDLRAAAVEATNPIMATAGAAQLRVFVNDLHDRNPAAAITVIGHSYGSTVAGIAASHGLAADNVVLIGSPGAGVNHASQMHLNPGGKVYAATYVDDPIRTASQLGALSNDPTASSFGATEVVPVGFHANAHSSYYAQGSVALGFIASVVNGQW